MKAKHAISKCSICGKPLSDPVSVAIGMGSVCRLGLKIKSYNSKNQIDMFGQNSTDYTYQILSDKVIAIADRNRGGKSVTNDIENVLEEIQESENINLADFKVMYKDSEGDWTGVTMNKGRIGFFFVGDRRMSMNEAKLKLIEITK